MMKYVISFSYTYAVHNFWYHIFLVVIFIINFEERIAMMIQFDDNFDLKLSCSADE